MENNENKKTDPIGLVTGIVLIVVAVWALSQIF